VTTYSPDHPKFDPRDHFPDPGGLKIDSGLEDVLVACIKSDKVFCRTFLNDIFFAPFDDEHDKIFELLDDVSLKQVVVAAPRGTGKSSIITVAKPAKNICFNLSKYIVPVSASSPFAEQRSEHLKLVLTQNELIQKMWPSMRTSIFNKEQWQAGNHLGTYVMPRGAGQQTRGMNIGSFRPDLPCVDDLEDPENMDSEEQRRKKKDWFYSDLYFSVDRRRKMWRILVMGTLLHEDSLIAELLEDPEWASVRLEICDDDLISKFPNFISDEEVKSLYESYKRRGKLYLFSQEMRNMSTPPDQGFKQEYFQSYGLHPGSDLEITDAEIDSNPDWESVVLADPAKSLKANAAKCAVIGLSFNFKIGKIVLRDVVNDRFLPDQLYEQMFDMALRIRAHTIGYEETGLKEFISQPLRNAMLMKGLFFNLVPLKARGGQDGRGSGKIARVSSTLPLYRASMMYHNPAIAHIIEQQLLAFPKSKYWDVMDVLGYITELMEHGDRYFHYYKDDMETEEDIVREYLKVREEMHIAETMYDDMEDFNYQQMV